MEYQNPIIFSDYSDPDVIKVGDYYYMVASSFNHTPGIPILKSENLVSWKIISYVYDEIPFSRFNDVFHGDGCWAVSIRYHDGKFYVVIPFIDEGIYVSECEDIESGKWSTPRCLIKGKGIEDPCPIWIDDKCYLVVAFSKNRIGFNSLLAIYEVSTDLKENISKDYTIIFDGHNTQPTIEGPKFYQYNGYIYIMAPAGSVKSGWQTCLRSKNIFGPYEEKIVMMQNDSNINGPHQGALIPLIKGGYAFIHFQDLGVYGRVINLQPCTFINDWPICGEIKDDLLPGTPYSKHEYLIDKKSNYEIVSSDDFKEQSLSLMWQTPSNMKISWYRLDDGLYLKSIFHSKESSLALNLTPNLFLTKIVYRSFIVSTKCEFSLNEGEEVGLTFMGEKYAYIAIKRVGHKNHIMLCKGEFDKEKDIVIKDEIFEQDEIIFKLKFELDLTYKLGYDDFYFEDRFVAYPGRWVGGKYGIYSRSDRNSNNEVLFKYFKVKEL